MWRFALLCIAACAPTWTKPSYRLTALADARAKAAHDYNCPADRINFKRDATYWRSVSEVWEPGGVIGTVMTSAPRWKFVFDVCGTQRTYVREVTDSPYRDPSFAENNRTNALEWFDL